MCEKSIEPIDVIREYDFRPPNIREYDFRPPNVIDDDAARIAIAACSLASTSVGVEPE